MKDINGIEVPEKITGRMGREAPEHKASAETVTPVAQPLVPPGASMDFAAFGERQVPKDADAETPAARPFPVQGSHVRQEGEYFVYKGFAGVAFRSKNKTAPDIKARDPRQPVITADVRVRIFDLSNEQDIQAYALVWDRAAKDLFVAPVEERQWVPETQNWKVFMRWGVKYWELPEDA